MSFINTIHVSLRVPTEFKRVRSNELVTVPPDVPLLLIKLSPDRNEANPTGQTLDLYQLVSTGELLFLEKHLLQDEVVVHSEEEGLLAEGSHHSEKEYLLRQVMVERGLKLKSTHPDLSPPFSVLKCPLCQRVDTFVSEEFSTTSCPHCRARFDVPFVTLRDGWRVDCFLETYSFKHGRYFIPPTDELSLSLTMIGGGDLRQISHETTEAEPGLNCSISYPNVSHKNHPVLRPGLHLCNIRELNGWWLNGRAITHLDSPYVVFQVEDTLWPMSAIVPMMNTGYFEQETKAMNWQKLGQSLQEAGDQLPLEPHQKEALFKLVTQQTTLPQRRPEIPARLPLPDPGKIDIVEFYLLHHWLIDHGPGYGITRAYPVWYVVMPAEPLSGKKNRKARHVFEIVRRNICPRCANPVDSKTLNDIAWSSGMGILNNLIPHYDCQPIWALGWEPFLHAQEEVTQKRSLLQQL